MVEIFWNGLRVAQIAGVLIVLAIAVRVIATVLASYAPQITRALAYRPGQLDQEDGFGVLAAGGFVLTIFLIGLIMGMPR